MEKYKLLLKLKSMTYEINEILKFTEYDTDTYKILKDYLNTICEFICCKDNEECFKRVCKWDEIIKSSEDIRTIINEALSRLEKYEAQEIIDGNKEYYDFRYNNDLMSNVEDEVLMGEITSDSKIIFLGSGAMPLSAFTIAKITGAKILCVDIDSEAIMLSRKIAKILGVHNNVLFSNKDISEIEEVKNSTHIIIASLVNNKINIIKGIESTIQDETKVILRYGNFIKSVFNYPLKLDEIKKWKKKKINVKNNFYDSIMLEKKYEFR